MHRASLRFLAATAAVAALAFASPGCGGGGGPGPDGAGQGLALVSFLQNGVNNLSLNQTLEFRFSEPVDPASVHSASMQVREGPSFGRAVNGVYRVVGSTVFFEPTLPGRCDLTDAGFQPGKTYRITLVGFPEQFSIKNLAGETDGGGAYIPNTGQPLRSTMNFEFKTRVDTDPLLFIDQVAATSPTVVTATPSNGTPVVKVEAGNKIVITFSENLDPCTVNTTNIRFQEWERGAPGTFNPGHVSGRQSGFTTLTPSTVDDGNVGNPFSWGSSTGGAVAPPQLIRSAIALTQSFSSTVVTITPEFGRFPENALCVVELTFGIKDLGGSTLVPVVFAFTTENLMAQNGTYALKFLGETPIDASLSSADVNTARSPGRAQGWWLLAGDGDNGANILTPGLPNQTPGCTTPLQQNDGVKDNLDANTGNIILDTGLTLNTCPNATDGSVAVVYEFASFRIRSGRHVFLVGENPAIILVQGAVTIDANARLHLRSANTTSGAAQNNGTIGNDSRTVDPAGGAGVAGGGDGGKGYRPSNSVIYADAGMSPAGAAGGQNVLGGPGGGLGGVQATKSSFGTGFGCAGGGGGGGHSAAGSTGGGVQTANNPFKGVATGNGGGIVGTLAMFAPSAGGGGGGGGSNTQTASTFIGYDGGGGGGGGGAGFCDFTSALSITVNGIINAQGGNGGSGEGPHPFYLGGAGAGGGAGGGVRLLSPGVINITGAQILCTGGLNGIGYTPTGGTANNGGVGSVGRIAIEDSDGIIDGLGSATLTPAPGGGPTGGFWTGTFDQTRFTAGSRTPALTTSVFFVGPANPDYDTPATIDFVSVIPPGSERPGPGATSILIEAQGFQLQPDGTFNPTPSVTWRTIGHIKNSGVPSAPDFMSGNPGDVILPPGNPGGASSINLFDTCEFLQLRVTFYLNTTMGPFDPGPYLDDWTIRFTYNQ